MTGLRARLLADLHGLHVAQPDRLWLYGLRPGADATIVATRDVRYTINTDGFRDRPRTRTKPNGAFRVVVLGDSITFGYGLAAEATFPAQLEERLARATPGRHLEVLNLGVSGYNPYNEAMLFADVGVTYQPDVVLQQFCANDLNDPTLHYDASTQLALGAIPDVAYTDPSRRRPKYGLNLPGNNAASNLAFKFGNVIDSFTLDVALNALETEGRGRVLSSPKIATQNNERAEIEQGVRIPVVNTTATEINVEFVSASLKLSVTPQITSEGTVILDINVENNTPDYS